VVTPVSRLGVGAAGAQAVVEPAGARVVAVDQAPGGLDALGDRADRGRHDLGGHVGRRVQGVDADPGPVEPFREVDRVEDLRQLGLAVGPAAAVTPGQHHVIEVDGLLAERADVHDPGRRGGLEQRQQPLGEREAGQVVHREPELVAVGALLPRSPARHLGADAGVVHQHVQPRLVREDLAREGADLRQVGQIGPVGAHRAAAELGDGVRDPLSVAAVDENGRAVARELGRQRPSESVGRSGYQDHLAVK
jgi:hypothetical protein